MKIVNAAMCVLAMSLTGGAANAQHHHHRQNHYTPSYNFNHHDHVVRDSHGHVIGQYHHNVVQPNSTYVVPHTGGHHHGTYYSHNGGYYYHPQTASSTTVHTVARPMQVQFGGFSHLDDLAGRLETLVNEFCLDLHYNYSHNHGYAETYREAFKVLETAKFIHAAEHQQDRQAIATRLNGIDELFHHVQDDVRGWSRHHHQQVGQLGILSKMDLIESTLHHLMYDAGVQHAPAAGATAPVANGMAGSLGTASAPGAVPPPPPVVMWHIAVNGEAQGPFGEGQLAQSIQSGQVSRATLVWSPAIGNWTPAGQVPALSGLFGATASSPPPIPFSSAPASSGVPLTTSPPPSVP
ncbi:MAG: DUF4339 domain-containing protein [Planctomycetaceae bacterium]|nr:DUF4339 domain-containing protein [Planctomycetaceae bacterium]